jgi:ribonuclease HI
MTRAFRFHTFRPQAFAQLQRTLFTPINDFRLRQNKWLPRAIQYKARAQYTTLFSTLFSLYPTGPQTITMNRKRPAPSTTATTSTSSSKKRKTDNVQKYYAVQVGFRPGVYLNYAECSQQTAGFKGALCKFCFLQQEKAGGCFANCCWMLVRSFTSREDAEAFAAGKKVAATSSGPDKFYAVAVGNPTGIFREWEDAAEAIKGVKGPKYKKFASRAEAVQYIRENGSKEAIIAVGEPVEPAKKAVPGKAVKQLQPLALPQEDVIRVYTDGSSLSNGKAGSRAGVGVYFGAADARNISERLEGEPQTNQRAELMAMLRALQVCPSNKAVRIVSDSQYSINCVTQWAVGWKRKGWLTASGEKVKNQDIIRAVLDKMEERTKAGGMTHFEWVKGHASDRGNEAADRLAVQGARMS